MEINPIILILAGAVFAVVFVYTFWDVEPLILGMLIASFALTVTLLSMFIEAYNDTLEMTFYERHMLILVTAFLYLYMTSFFAKYTLNFELKKSDKIRKNNTLVD